MFCRLKTVLFDLDGTLLDTAPDLALALNQLVTQEGSPPVSYEKVREVASDGSRGLLALGLGIDDTHPDYAKFRNLFIDLYQQHLCVQTTLFPGMESVLDQLEEQHLLWGVVTNKPSFLAKELLGNLDLAHRCACIIGGDSTPNPKPYPDPLLLACDITKTLPKECVYIGDAPRDITAAKSAGMRSIAALYGYLSKDCIPERWNADYYIDHPKDILTWVEKQIACQMM